MLVENGKKRMTKKIIYITVCLLSLHFCMHAQSDLLDSVSLATYQEYSDLDAALENPNNVVKLILRKKKYREFPMQVLKFKNLQYLDLSKNIIKEIPDSIVALEKLQVLIVSSTKLEHLPKNIGQLKNLKHLNANQNNLTTVPYSIGDLESLEIVDLWSNNLDYFPETLAKLKKLKVMDLRNIIISQKEQDKLQSWLPQAKIYFNAPCNCQ